MRLHLGHCLTLALLASLPTLSAAQVFKCTQSSGLVTYSDKPCHIVSRNPVLERSTDQVEKVAPKEPDTGRLVTARAEPDANKSATSPAPAAPAAPPAPTAESLQLRALGPSQALDRQGKVYNRVANGYIDANGTFYAGIATGHR